jgi:hypothetical protein
MSPLLLARSAAIPKPPVTGQSDAPELSAADFWEELGNLSPVHNMLSVGKDFYEDWLEHERQRGNYPTPEQKENAKKSLGGEHQGVPMPGNVKDKLKDPGMRSVANGVSAPDDSGFVDAKPDIYSGTFLPQEAYSTESLPQDHTIGAYSNPASNGIEDLTYGNPFPTDAPDTSIMHIIKEKGGNWVEGAVELGTDNLKYNYSLWLPTDNGFEPEGIAEIQYEAEVYNTIGEQLIAQRNSLRTLHNLQNEDDGFDWSDEIDDLKEMIANNESKSEWNDWVETKLNKYIKTSMGTQADPVRKRIKETGMTHIQSLDDVYSAAVEDNTDLDLDPEDQLEYRREQLGYDFYGSEAPDSPESKWEYLSDDAFAKSSASEQVNQFSPDWMKKLPGDTIFHDLYTGALSSLGFGHVRDEIANTMRPDSGLPANLQIRPGKLGKMSVPDVLQRVADINEWRSLNLAEADKQKAFNRATHPIEELQYDDYGWVELADKGLTMSDLQGGIDPLQVALEYEGDTMGHCVGGYCGKVRGGTKIYSLRDSEGGPHTTIEGHDKDGTLMITQIKGKQNNKPKPEYVEMVQDFIYNQDDVEFAVGYNIDAGVGDHLNADMVMLDSDSVDAFERSPESRNAIIKLAREYDDSLVDDISASYIADEVANELLKSGKKYATFNDVRKAIEKVDRDTRI